MLYSILQKKLYKLLHAKLTRQRKFDLKFAIYHAFSSNSNSILDVDWVLNKTLHANLQSLLHSVVTIEWIKSSRPKVFHLENFAKRTGKHLCQSLIFNKVADRLWLRCFPVNFMKFSRTSFLQNTSGWLTLMDRIHKIVQVIPNDYESTFNKVFHLKQEDISLVLHKRVNNQITYKYL